MLVYHVNYNNPHSDDNSPYAEDAIDFARGMVWGEVESSEQTIAYHTHIETVNDVGVYYDYGADYYFFTDES